MFFLFFPKRQFEYRAPRLFSLGGDLPYRPTGACSASGFLVYFFFLDHADRFDQTRERLFASMVLFFLIG